MSQTFVKYIDIESVQVVTLLSGRVYVDIMDIEEFNQIYKNENYFIA